MKVLRVFAALALFPCILCAEEPVAPVVTESAVEVDAKRISDADAVKHIGESVVVIGGVVAVGVSKQGNVYMSFGGRFPNQTFSAVVKAADVARVGDVQKYVGKPIAIGGKIELYNEKPQIVVTSPEQIMGAE